MFAPLSTDLMKQFLVVAEHCECAVFDLDMVSVVNVKSDVFFLTGKKIGQILILQIAVTFCDHHYVKTTNAHF
jgi:hypothetical protein